MTMTAPLRVCRRCGVEKGLAQFSSDGRSGRLRARCKPCEAELMRDRRRNGKAGDRAAQQEKFRARLRADPRRRERYRQQWHANRLRNTYGMTREDLDALVLAQEGRCAICLHPTRRLVVDHCHTTGRVRGLLCVGCNTGLGRFGDDPERLRRALAYLG